MVCLDDDLSTSLIIQPDSNSITNSPSNNQPNQLQNIDGDQETYKENLDLLSAPSIRNPGFQNADNQRVKYKENYEPFTTPQAPQPTLAGYFPLGSPYETTSQASKELFIPSDTLKPERVTTTKRIASVTSAFLATTKTVPKFALYNAIPSAQTHTTTKANLFVTETTTSKLNVISTVSSRDKETIEVLKLGSEKKETEKTNTEVNTDKQMHILRHTQKDMQTNGYTQVKLPSN